MKNTFPLALSYDDVLLVPQYSEVESRSEVDLTTKITPRITISFPLIATNMLDVTNVKVAVVLGKLGGLAIVPRFVPIDEQAEMVREIKKNKVPCAASIGLREGAEARAEALVKAGVDALHIDVANGHMAKTVRFTKLMRKRYGKSVDIMSGVVATADGAERLFDAGANNVNVGIGGGSICITRIQTGCGVPNLTTILNTAKIARKYGRSIIVDGGTKTTGDAVKALAAGASGMRCGYMLAGFDESPGKLITKGDKKYKQYNGSTSPAEKRRHVEKIGNELSDNYTKHIEGVESIVPYKGGLADFVESASANIKSGFSYCGAKKITELWKNAKFIRVTPGGMRESGAHDVIVS